MSTPVQKTMEVNTPASVADFRAKSAADKVLSYMWYTHVLVSVNTEARLRANIARVLEHSSSSVTSVPASPHGTCIDHTGVSDHQHEQQSPLNLSDHLILWLFNHKILARLIDIAPVFAQANGYAFILVDVPVSFREEFCQRLYTLLFSKRIVEWPHGIDVPEPAIAAAEPVIVDDNVPVELEDTHLSSEREQQREIGGAGYDGAMEDKDEAFGSPASSLRPAASIWLQTPSLSSWGGDDIPHMQRAAYFGTVSNPLPMNYFADWEWSRNGSGARSSVNEYNVSSEQLKAPFPSPQKRSRTPPQVLQTPQYDSNPDITPSPPPTRQQGREIPSVMYGDGIKGDGGEGSRRASGITTGSGVCRFGRGRIGTGHTVLNQPIVSDAQHDSEFGWGKGSPVAGPFGVSAHSRSSSYIFGIPPSAERGETNQPARGHINLPNTETGHCARFFRSGEGTGLRGQEWHV